METKIIDTAQQASAVLGKDIENAQRVAQAAKDLADKWASLADEESRRLEAEKERRRVKDEILEKVAHLDRAALDKVSAIVKEIK